MNDWSTETRPRTVWLALAAMYGAQFVREFGESPPDVWTSALRRLSDGEIKHGLASLGREGGSRPPTLPAFLQACRGGAVNDHPRLPPPQTCPYQRRANVVLLKYLLANGGVHPAKVPRLVEVKRRVAGHFRVLADDRDPGAEQFLPKLRERFDAIMAEADPPPEPERVRP